MKITKLELFKVKPRWMFLKMYTDTDLVGLGEPIREGHALAVEAVIREFEEYLIGKDPMQIEHHVQALYRGGFYRGGPLMLSAISGIEQAMWDIKGKYYHCPVYEMLGDIAELEDIANAAWYLGSEESRNTTGTELVVDGGMLAQLTPNTERKL